MPRWVDEVAGDYTRRLTGTLKVILVEVPAGQRSSRGDPAQAMHTEGQRILALLRPAEFVVALDEHGTQMTTRELATWLAGRMQEGRDVALVIGGPDGLAAEVRRARTKLSLSRLTLPHRPGARRAGRAVVSGPYRPQWTSVSSRLRLARYGGCDVIGPVLRLASASPRRRELLAQIGVPHTVAVADVDESRPGEAPVASTSSAWPAPRPRSSGSGA